MEEFNVGSTIRDPNGNHWAVSRKWKYIEDKTLIEYLCLSLVGVGRMVGQMGGARFRKGEVITVKR